LLTLTGVASATVNSDLGSVYSIDHLALWNEEYSGISFLDISKSLDNINFITVASELVPVDNPLYLDYGAEVFGFGSQSARHIQFDVGDCPQPDGNSSLFTVLVK